MDQALSKARKLANFIKAMFFIVIPPTIFKQSVFTYCLNP